jgi:hypothetical protein
MAKLTVTKWSREGYQTTCRTLNGLQVGGVVDRSWLIVARIPADALNGWAWPHVPELVTRPMSNCLQPTGVPWSAYHSSKKHQDGTIPHAHEDSMPARPGSFIRTDRGMRRLLHDELAKGLGTPKIWIGDCYRNGGTLQHTVALHILESLSPLLYTEDVGASLNPQDPHNPAYFVSEPPPKNAAAFDWRPPDLSPQGAWYKARVEDLLYPDPGPLIEEGLLILRRHRGNYNAEGPDPTYLQLLWWMFPWQHWDGIREGSSMNFLVEPRRELTPNSVMDEEQIVIAE